MIKIRQFYEVTYVEDKAKRKKNGVTVPTNR